MSNVYELINSTSFSKLLKDQMLKPRKVSKFKKQFYFKIINKEYLDNCRNRIF
jgi:hypothetical protein